MQSVKHPQPAGGTPMVLKTVKVRLPEEILSYFGDSSQEVEAHVAQAILLQLVASGKITASYAAETLNMNYREMLQLLEQHEIPTINYEPGEVEREADLLREHANNV